MPRYTEPDEYQTASLVSGLPTCTFHPKPYRRIITNIVVGNSTGSIVVCYRAILGSIPVAQNQLGANNTLTGDIIIPAGQSFFVQWSAAGDSVSDAFARVSWERDSDPFLADNPATGQRWASNSVATFQFPNGVAPDEAALIVGPDLPACMLGVYAAAIFWRPPESITANSPIYYIAQRLSPSFGGGSQEVDYGLLIYNGVDCGYAVYKRVFALTPNFPDFDFVQESYGWIETSPGSSFAGNAIQFSYSDSLLMFLGNTFLSFQGGEIVIDSLSASRIQINGINTQTISSSNANLNGPADNTVNSNTTATFIDYPGARIAIDKLYDTGNTELLIRFSCTFLADSATAGAEIGVLVDGTDYLVERVTAPIGIGLRYTAVGEVTVPGLPIGFYDVQGRITLLGAGNIDVTIDDDFWSLSAQECYVNPGI